MRAGLFKAYHVNVVIMRAGLFKAYHVNVVNSFLISLVYVLSVNHKVLLTCY